VSLPPTPPTPPTPPAAACTPGQGGVPDSLIGEVLCGRYLTDAPSTAWHWAAGHWPVVAAVLLGLAVLRLGFAGWRRHAWRRHAANARWLEIVPPVTATPTATVHLWRLLATLLAAPRLFTLRPARVVWEAQADPTGMRCGLWVPPGINPTAVLRVVQRAWPGARVADAHPPAPPGRWPAAGLALVATVPEWQPLIDDPPPATTSRREGSPAEQDRLRAVYDGLAAAGRTGGGLLQVIVGRAPRHRVANLRRASTNPARARRPNGGLRAAALLAEALRAGILAVLDLLTPGPSTSTTDRGARTTDPYQVELARQARLKYATAPHLLVAVHALAVGPTTAAARAAAADITSGYGLLSGHLTRRRLRHARTAARWRWAPATRMTLATVAETAALAGLPAEPATFGMPAAASRHRLPGRDTWRPAGPPQPGHQATTRRAVRATRPPATAGADPAAAATADGGLFTTEEGDCP
jgi:hypothetical protein